MQVRDYERLVEHSSYLQGLLKKYPDLEVENNPFTALQEIIDDLARVEGEHSPAEVELALIEAKARFAWHWACAERLGVGTFAERGEWQTTFAEQCIDVALHASWQAVAEKQPLVKRALDERNGRMPGLFILGLGKLGGGDLNFSSDTDLIGYFDPDVLPVPKSLGQSYVGHQVLQKLTQILGRKGKSDFIWRVDWRLRPNASATTLAMSTVAAREYYFYRASPWHRLALMKARVVAGDKSVGHHFLDLITPFIWRQNLDYRALDELGEIKNKINLEHPSLRVERRWREPINEDICGFNVKLGSGGIREIEFIANALQLVWGGRHYELRTSNTLQALQALAELGLLTTEVAQKLADAYRFLRSVENAIQIRANQQAHQIPENQVGQEALIGLLGDMPWPDFVAQINTHRRAVSQKFEELFAEQAEASGDPIVWPKDLSNAALEVVSDWDKGFLNYGVSRDMRLRLRPLKRALAEALGTADDPSNTAVRLHEFFRALPQGEQYFRLLAESPALLDCIIPPLLHSPPMTKLLRQSPHIIDCFLHSDRLDIQQVKRGESQYDSEYVTEAQNYEIRLERMRRFVNEQLYQLYLAFLRGQLLPLELQQALTELAEHTLELALAVVSQEMGLPEVPVAVLGMGKMGVRRMSPQSDLDLIFVFDPQSCDLEVATRFVSRLQTAISTPMREGVVYELDTRLRPSGKSGAPTVSIESFRSHQLDKARNWEHIALVSAHFSGGNRALAETLHQVKAQVVGRTRDQAQLLKDAHKMWSRISQHRVKDVAADVLFSKLRPGGLMQAEYLAACQVLSKEVCTSEIGFAALLKQVDSEGQLAESISFWQTLQIWERLLGLEEQPIAAVAEPYKEHLCAHLGIDSFAEIAELQKIYAQRVLSLETAFFTDLPNTWDAEDWQETAVHWVS